MKKWRLRQSRLLWACSSLLCSLQVAPARAQAQPPSPPVATALSADERIEALQRQVAEQGRQLEVLRQRVDQAARLEAARERAAQQAIRDGQVPTPGQATAAAAAVNTPQGPAPGATQNDRPGDGSQAVRVGVAPAAPEAPAANVAQLFDQPGVLTPRGKFVFEPSFQYGY